MIPIEALEWVGGVTAYLVGGCLYVALLIKFSGDDEPCDLPNAMVVLSWGVLMPIHAVALVCIGSCVVGDWMVHRLTGSFKHGEHRQAATEDNGGPAAHGAGSSGPGFAGTSAFPHIAAYQAALTSQGGLMGGVMGQLGQLANAQMQGMVAQQLAAQSVGWTSSAVGPSIGFGMVPAATMEPPKLENGGIQVGEIIAWRWWYCEPNGYLRSCTTMTLWPTAEPLKASAEPNGTGPGIYAFKTEQDAINDRAGPILGRVMLWGTVVEYERGYTAEYAKIISLDRWLETGSRELDALKSVRFLYGIPLDGSVLAPTFKAKPASETPIEAAA